MVWTLYIYIFIINNKKVIKSKILYNSYNIKILLKEVIKIKTKFLLKS